MMTKRLAGKSRWQRNCLIFCAAFLTTLLGSFASSGHTLDATFKGFNLSHHSSARHYPCTGDAPSQLYYVTLEMIWSQATHPDDFPNFPHYSPPIGAVHNTNYNLWQPDQLATPGIESMAESGNTSTLITEINQQISSGNAIDVIGTFQGFSSPGSWAFGATVTPDYPLISFTTMIAPSPDWFVGIHDINLCQNGEWINSLRLNLYAYDAGTDSGASYESANADTNPAEVISLINTTPFVVNSELVPVGVAIIERQE